MLVVSGFNWSLIIWNGGLYKIFYILFEFEQYNIMEQQLRPQSDHQNHFYYNRLNLILKTAASMKKWKKFADKSKDRYNRLNQLITTEEIYLRDLQMLKQKVKQQLLNAKIITLQQSNQMFPNLDGMIELSKQLHRDLKQIFLKWNRKMTLIGATMCRFASFFKLYSDFFKNFNQTQQKLKKLLSTSEQAKTIQRNLSLPNRIITFDDLLSKPFQRSLKYHLLLRDYCNKIDSSHPDFVNLQKAIDLYHKVNEQNNLSMENKEKRQTLVSLDSKFGNVVSEARNYITQYDAICFQTPVVVYLFSNLLILVFKKPADREMCRISFNKFSHVESAGDGLLFKNRLYFYGEKICIHLSFADKLIRDEAFSCMKQLIEEMNQNQNTRETIITQRISRFSHTNLKRKFSFTNLQPQLLRPIVMNVLGTEQRTNKSNITKNYYIFQFFPQKQNLNISFTPHHISVLAQDQIAKFQKLISQLYPDELLCLPLNTKPRHLINDIQYFQNEQKRTEIKSVLIQLYLNSILRNPIILKRIDIVLYLLEISNSIWNILKSSSDHMQLCQACIQRAPQYFKPEDYNKQILERQYSRVNPNKSQKRYEYCQFRTIISQQNFSQIFPQMMYNAKSQDKIAWCKSKLGWINQTLTNTQPSSKFVNKITLKIYYRGFPSTLQFQVNCLPNDPVRKIISMIGQKRQMNLQEYALIAQMDKNAVVLCDDQPISKIFEDTKQEEGVFDKISSFFHKKQEIEINLYLQKYWVIFSAQDFTAPDKARRLKVNSEVESIMSRLSSSQLKMKLQDMLQLYGLFLCKKYFSQYKHFNYQKIATRIRNPSQFYFPPKIHDESNINLLVKTVQNIKDDQSIKSDFDIGVRILQKASSKPGWSCIMFDASQEMSKQKVPVKIGCDLNGVHVRQPRALAFYLQFALKDDDWSHNMTGNILMLTRNQKTFKFMGRQVWKVQQQIQFYKTYLKAFSQN